MTSYPPSSQTPADSAGTTGVSPPRLDLSPGELAEAVQQHPVAYWYLVAPDRLHHALSQLPACVRADHPLVQMMHALTAGDTAAIDESTPPDDSPVSHLIQSARLRLAGHPRAALERVHTGQIEASLPPASALFDTSRGWRPFVTLQSGVTALLAGDFSRSAGRLATATLWRLPDEVRTLEREAHAKYALLHALVGDTEIARRVLIALDRLPRSASWTEPEIGYAARLAGHLVAPDPAGDARDPLLAADARELWPFGLWAVLRPIYRRGHLDDALGLLTQVEHAEPPGLRGDGVARSIIPIARAMAHRLRGEHTAARAALEAADPDCDLTLSGRALVLLESGLYDAAIQTAEQVIARAGELRRLRISSTGVIAAALLRRGDGTGATDLLRRCLAHTRPPSDDELAAMPTDAALLLRALRHEGGGAPGDAAPGDGALTRGEEHLLVLLATTMTRQEIADELYLSINTIKTRCHRLYRRLGVQSRTAAIAEARRRGLI
ncbi:LuxR C-terminal-related transcriptional regulator [Microbacterium sp. HA-8]|uniref:LuxR C-terminal-related transcriptional regulator n=1 Tax=Microbacterium sp. HA-8 TaxID=3234200 RepID=UPI0038F614A1